MQTIKIMRPLRTRRTTTNGGLFLIRRVLNDYAPLDLITKKFGEKLFGIPLISVIIAMVFRAILGGGSFYNFEKEWNNDTKRGIFAVYCKNLSHALLSKNLKRFKAKIMRPIVMGMVKDLYTTGRVKLEQVAIDSTKITADGESYQKTGLTKMKGNFYKGYKLHLLFDVIAMVPIAYMITSINVHDNKMLINLVKMNEKHYGKPSQEILIDRGYYGAEFFKFLKKQNINFVIPAKRFSAMKEAISEAKIEEFKKIRGSKLYYKDSELNISNYGKIRCILIANKKFEDWMPEEAKKKIIWGLLTTNSTLSPTKIIHHYRARWQIEVFFRSCRQQLGLNNLPSYDYCIVVTHIGSVMLAYISLAICALEDDDGNELTSIKITEWQRTFVKFSATCEIYNKCVNFYFGEKCWLHTHLKTFCPEGKVIT